jgi:hypothetical protein
MSVKVANNASTSLAASIASSDLAITVNPGTGGIFPSVTAGSGDYFYGTLQNASGAVEVVKVTNRTGDTLTVTRGVDNTTAALWSVGDKFEIRPVAALFNDKLDVADAAAAYTPIASIAPFTGKNRIINGDMRVQQRAALSITTATAGFGVCDRWKGSNSAPSGAFTLSVVNNADINGVIKPFALASVTSAFPASFSGTNSAIPFWQIIEGLNSYDLIGQQFTVSFTVRGNVPGTYGVGLRDSGSSYSIVKTFTLNAASTPQYVSLTFPAVPSGAALPISNGIGLGLFIGAVGGPSVSTSTYNTWQAGNTYCAASATNWLSGGSGVLNITDVQLEAGTIATPFERRPYGQELALCQRYYQAITCSMRAWASTANSFWNTNVSFTPMRATPTATIQAGGSGFNYASRAFSLTDSANARFEIVATSANSDCYSLATPVTLNAEL